MGSIKKITICFCEGSHDTAFLYRILKTKCYESFKATLKDLPNSIGAFIIAKNKTVGYDKLKIDSLKNEFVPYKIMINESKMILLYSLGGDSDNKDDEKNKRLILLKHFIDNMPKGKDEDSSGGEFNPQSGDAIKYSFLFFYDADKNKQKQLKKVNDYLKKMEIQKTLKHNEIIEENGYSIGVYIFSDKDDVGSLEDILLELMKKNNEKIFEKAEEYYNCFFDENKAKRLSTKCDGNIPKDKKDGKSIDRKKSILGIVGQLQNKGKSNVVTIADSSYLTLDKINNSPKLQEIADFIEK